MRLKMTSDAGSDIMSLITGKGLYRVCRDHKNWQLSLTAP
jgi:hypothetical protein